MENQSHDISFTEDAIKQAKIFMEEPCYKNMAIRVYVEGKGCAGFTYGVSFDTPTKEDAFRHQDGVDIIVDPGSLTFIKGSVVDWINDERGTGFLVENPKANKFKGKFYKRKNWLDQINATPEPRV